MRVPQADTHSLMTGIPKVPRLFSDLPEKDRLKSYLCGARGWLSQHLSLIPRTPVNTGFGCPVVCACNPS